MFVLKSIYLLKRRTSLLLYCSGMNVDAISNERASVIGKMLQLLGRSFLFGSLREQERPLVIALTRTPFPTDAVFALFKVF